MLAAVALSVSGMAATSKTARKRAKTRAIKEVAHYLGNTPAVARSSYIDPRVFDRFDGGVTISGALPELMEDSAAWPEVQRRWRRPCSTCSRTTVSRRPSSVKELGEDLSDVAA